MKQFNLYAYSITTLFLLAGSNALHAEIYRWVDENGVTNYSNEPIKEKKTEGQFEIIEYTIPKKRKDPEAKNEDEKTKDEKDKQPTVEKLKELLSEEEIKAILKEKIAGDDKQDNCTSLRRNLAALNERNFAPFRDENGDYRVSWGDGGLYKGKREYLSNAEVTTEAAEITKRIKQDCPQEDEASTQEEVRANWIRSEHCALNKAILTDLKRPELRTADSSIEAQEEVVQRYCAKLEDGEHRDDEEYYPKSFPVRKRQ